MRKNVKFTAAAVSLIVVCFAPLACSDDPVAPTLPAFNAGLNQVEERPIPSTTGASGTATFTDNTTSIDYTLEVANMTAVAAAHIHVGATGVIGPIIVNLYSPAGVSTRSVNGILSSGTIYNTSSGTVSLDSLRVLFNNGNSYVNVHTVANPAGEIRAQVRRNN